MDSVVIYKLYVLCFSSYKENNHKCPNVPQCNVSLFSSWATDVVAGNNAIFLCFSSSRKLATDGVASNANAIASRRGR